MTREEAIERLNIHKSTSVFVDSIAEAIDIAIEALQTDLVRCKDCQHYGMGNCYMYGGQMSTDDFCSRAERKQDD